VPRIRQQEKRDRGQVQGNEQDPGEQDPGEQGTAGKMPYGNDGSLNAGCHRTSL
jgi:hypothetical protein